MKLFVGVTDFDWFTQLSERSPSEVNFWQPSGRTRFRALDAGDLFLFKLHAPRNFIVGGGVFAHFSLLPMSLAWSAFGPYNGVRDLGEMRARIARYRRSPDDGREDFTIGCIVLTQPIVKSSPSSFQSRIGSECRPTGARTSCAGRPTTLAEGTASPCLRLFATPLNGRRRRRRWGKSCWSLVAPRNDSGVQL